MSKVLIIGLFITALAGCAPARTTTTGEQSAPSAPSSGLQDVRVQQYQDPRMGGKPCLVFTHDTAQGAAVAVVC